MGCDNNNDNCKISTSKCVDNFCRVNGTLNACKVKERDDGERSF